MRAPMTVIAMLITNADFSLGMLLLGFMLGSLFGYMLGANRTQAPKDE